MKRVSNSSIALSATIASSGLIMIGGGVRACGHFLNADYWGNLVLTIAGVVLFSLYLIGALRLLFFFHPLKEGEVFPGTTDWFVYNTYVLLCAAFFHSFFRFLPSMFSHIFYRLFGAKIGSNTYIVGILFDPFFVTIGANGVIGTYALVVPHITEGDHQSHYRIRIGDNVTIGAHAVVMAGCTIGDNAIVAMNAVVTKHTVIGPNEIWGGTPARLIGRRNANGHPETKIKGDLPCLIS